MTCKDRQTDSPLISIILPIYNVEKYIDQCLKSISEQTYKNLEILLINDGSPDNSIDICNRWSQIDPRFHVYTKKNGGAASARNYGLELATGDYISFIDPDDWVQPEMYETLLHNMLAENADLSIITGKYVYDDGTIRHYAKPNQYLVLTPQEAFKYVNIQGYIGIAPWNKLYKREFFDNGLRFPEGVRASDDYIVTYTVLDEAKKIVYSSKELYNYRLKKKEALHTPTNISLEPLHAAKEMLNLVEKKYPETIPWALYGYVRLFLSVYDQFLMQKKPTIESQKNKRQILQEVRDTLKNNYILIKRYVSIPSKRRLQLCLLMHCPKIYDLSFKLYKLSHPERIE